MMPTQPQDNAENIMQHVQIRVQPMRRAAFQWNPNKPLIVP